MKCGDCTRQAFKPVDDAAVIAHLKGQHVMGVYPMQGDETCWFLAVDFDKSAWMDDVRAFVQTSRRMGLPLAVERSPRATERTSRFSLRLPWRRPQLAGWVATSLLKRWPADTSLAWTPTTGCFPARTRCRGVSATISRRSRSSVCWRRQRRVTSSGSPQRRSAAMGAIPSPKSSLVRCASR